jgi:hypothetical protein
MIKIGSGPDSEELRARFADFVRLAEKLLGEQGHRDSSPSRKNVLHILQGRVPHPTTAEEVARAIWEQAQAPGNADKLDALQDYLKEKISEAPTESTPAVFGKFFALHLQRFRRLRRQEKDVKAAIRVLEAAGFNLSRLVGRSEATPEWLVLPDFEWDPVFQGPSALLRPEFRVVRFHGESRLAELRELLDWCDLGHRLRIRHYSGSGGIGKTRLGLELCHGLRQQAGGDWILGFFDVRKFDLKHSPWDTIAFKKRSLLIVVDYAADREKTKGLEHLLSHMRLCPAPRVRLLLLEREHLWLNRFVDTAEVRMLLESDSMERDRLGMNLGPVAENIEERHTSYEIAREAFASRLECESVPGSAPDLQGPTYDRVLLLHAAALLDVFRGFKPEGEDSILRSLLDRERAYWRRLAEYDGLQADLLPAVEAACYAVTLNQGAASIEEAMTLMREEGGLTNLSEFQLRGIAELLRECYPDGASGIAPLQPDTLAHYFVASFP